MRFSIGWDGHWHGLRENRKPVVTGRSFNDNPLDRNNEPYTIVYDSPDASRVYRESRLSLDLTRADVTAILAAMDEYDRGGEGSAD